MPPLLSNLIAAFLLPPLSLLLLGVTGFFILRRNHSKLGMGVIFSSVVFLWLGATPLTANWAAKLLEDFQDKKSDCRPQAIVVLGAGTYFDAPEYEGDTVTPFGLERLRLAAALHRKTGLPILTSGGNPDRRPQTEATLMKAVLERDFFVPVRWAEGNSQNTLENARFSKQILGEQGIDQIYLVTQAWHMPRSAGAFVHAGFCVTPVATGFSTKGETTPLSFLPHARELFRTSLVIHEAIGILWYRLLR